MRQSARTRGILLGCVLVAAAALGWRALSGGDGPGAPPRVAPAEEAAAGDGAPESAAGEAGRRGVVDGGEAGAGARAAGPVPPGPDERGLLRGRVVDEAGAGVVGARVALREVGPSAGDYARELESGPDGGFELEVPERAPLSLLAEAEGLAPAWRAPVFGGEAVTLVLRAPGRLEVLVRDPTGAPIEGAEVRVWSTPGAGPRAPRSPAWRRVDATDARGRVLVTAAPRADLSVLAQAGELVPARRRVDLAERADARLVLTLGEGLRLSGRVSASADGEPLEGARVGCDGLGYAETDAGGRYALRGIAPTASAWGVGATLAGYRPTYEYVRIDEATGDVELDFALEVGPALRGRVVDDSGQPVAGARVVAEGRQPTKAFTGEHAHAERTTAADGRFAIDPVHPMSRWTLSVRGPFGGVARLEAGPFPPEPGAADVGDVVLEAAASILGRIEGEPGPDAARVALRALSDEGAGRVVAVAWPDAWGAFRFDAVAPGRHLVELHADEDVEQGLPLAVAEVRLEAGELERVRLVAGSARIAGRVLDPAGRPAERARLLVAVLDGEGRTVARGMLRGEPFFELTVPGFGEHTVVLRDPTLRYEEERVPGVLPDGPELVVRLRERTGGRRIDGHLRRADGRPVEDVTVAFRDARSFDPLGRVAIPEDSGAFAIAGLEDRPYYVEVVDFRGRYEPRDPVLVRPGDGPVEIVLEPRS